MISYVLVGLGAFLIGLGVGSLLRRDPYRAQEREYKRNYRGRHRIDIPDDKQ